MIFLRVSISALICALALGACSAPENAAVPASSVQAGAVRSAGSSYKIYVANIGDGNITAFEPDSTQTTPTIEIGSSAYSDSLKTYRPSLDRIAPTITNGLYEPSGIAIH